MGDDGSRNLLLDGLGLIVFCLVPLGILMIPVLWDEFSRGWSDGAKYSKTRKVRKAREDWGHGYGDD